MGEEQRPRRRLLDGGVAAVVVDVGVRVEHEVGLEAVEERQDHLGRRLLHAGVDEERPLVAEQVLRERPRPEHALDPVDAGRYLHVRDPLSGHHGVASRRRRCEGVEADHELVVAAHDLEQDAARGVRVAGLDRVHERRVRVDAVLEAAEAADARRGGKLDVLADESAHLVHGLAQEAIVRSLCNQKVELDVDVGICVGVGDDLLHPRHHLAQPPNLIGGGALCGHPHDPQAEKLAGLDQLLDLLARHGRGRPDGELALLGHEGAAAVARLDEPVADQDADRLARRPEADLVARGELAVGGELVARVQDARLDLRAEIAGDPGRQRHALASARERQWTSLSRVHVARSEQLARWTVTTGSILVKGDLGNARPDRRSTRDEGEGSLLS